jgi:hypothetical protein
MNTDKIKSYCHKNAQDAQKQNQVFYDYSALLCGNTSLAIFSSVSVRVNLWLISVSGY